MRFHPIPKGKQSARIAGIVAACRGKANTGAEAVSTAPMPPKVASVQTKATGTTSTPSQPAPAPKPTPSAIAAPTSAGHQYKTFTPAELKEIAGKAMEEVRAEAAAKAKSKRAAATSVAWDRAYSRVFGLAMPDNSPAAPQTAAGRAWDRAYARLGAVAASE